MEGSLQSRFCEDIYRRKEIRGNKKIALPGTPMVCMINGARLQSWGALTCTKQQCVVEGCRRVHACKKKNKIDDISHVQH
jgi:hypothetical protein